MSDSLLDRSKLLRKTLRATPISFSEVETILQGVIDEIQSISRLDADLLKQSKLWRLSKFIHSQEEYPSQIRQLALSLASAINDKLPPELHCAVAPARPITAAIRIRRRDHMASRIAQGLEKFGYRYSMSDANTLAGLVELELDRSFGTNEAKLTQKFNEISNAFINNPGIAIRLGNGSLKPHELLFLSVRDLLPAAQREELDRERDRVISERSVALDAWAMLPAAPFPCKKCGSTTDLKMWEVQRRSADEPTDLIYRCLACGARYKG